MAPEVLARLIDAAAAAIDADADHLTSLDRAIGDGDHGINMKRGFGAVHEIRDELAGLPLPGALQKIGMTLVMKVGGASGPLYGSFFMAMGKAIPNPLEDPKDIAAAFAEGVAAVKRRGRSDAGEKTMLEVLVPVAEALRAGAREGAAPAALLARVREAAERGVESTRDMRATKGRASYLGERSIGHIDPGARSSQLLVHSVCDVAAAALPTGEARRA
ncbi:MAG: dihydroxyacetone kinase subunit DhaL [Kiloniellaceae bacterium]